ncbi:unnamed protein product [Paramecium primaurelia]|uniref:Uncharacterized protein n=1 Tax=Paramecium primaurelia TaxID=5886 RepID=A0A8S1JS46_PARPR|nr:unnamed protein product [Paramecium primaurelia]
MQYVNGTKEFQKKSSMQASDFINQEQLNQQTTDKTQGFNIYNSNIIINQNDNFKGQKHFSTNMNFVNSSNLQFQGKAMTNTNQFKIMQFSNQIEQLNKEKEKEKECQIKDLMKISQKAVQRRKERIFEKYMQPNQNIIEDQQS